ncbi:MAG TPA: hypothetical protein DCZ59_06960, partial [Bacteroidetes bacterium]|nr:hypothetical protein [Bacteroidota bacterium]
GGVGLVVASFLYFVRVNSDVENTLHILIPNDTLYETLRFIAWHPELATLAWSAGVLLVLGVLSLLLRLGAAFVRSRISLRDTFTIVTWSSLPFLIMLPIGIVLYQALTDNELSLVVPLAVLGVSIWVVLRILRATSVVFDVRPAIVYAIGFGFLLSAIVGLIVSLDFTHHGFAFLSHYVHLS